MESESFDAIFVLPPILSIPSEIRGKIFNIVSSANANNCRLVCQQFKTDIDTYFNYSASLHESEGHLQRITSLRLKSLVVRCFLGPPPSGHFGTRILLYPHILRSLSLPNSCISLENLHYLLVDSGKSLEKLDLNMNSSLAANIGLSHTDLFQYKLPKLKCLRLNLNTVPVAGEDESTVFFGGGLPSPLPFDSIPVLLLSSAMECLRTLEVQIRCFGFRQVSQLSTLVLLLILKTGKTLKHLEFDLIQGHGVPTSEERDLAESDLEKLDLIKLRNIALKEVRIVNSTAIGVRYWGQLLAMQRKLECVETDILPAPASLFHEIVLKNSATLVELDIGDLTLDFDEESRTTTPFNASVFGECPHLRKLTLDRNSIHRRISPVSPELVHLYRLPQTLKELNINYFLISSEELVFLFRSLPELSTLSLTQCGESQNCGVNGTALQQILLIPSIQFVEISPLNFNQGEEENIKLNLILLTFEYPEGHLYFQLRRVTSSSNVLELQINMDELLDTELDGCT